MGTYETQASISAWADAAFGPAENNLRVAIRANEEMAELLRALSVHDENPKAVEEIADVFIVLARLGEQFGVDIRCVVDDKMAINRTRQWKKDGTGHGYHVRPKGQP